MFVLSMRISFVAFVNAVHDTFTPWVIVNKHSTPCWFVFLFQHANYVPLSGLCLISHELQKAQSKHLISIKNECNRSFIFFYHFHNMSFLDEGNADVRLKRRPFQGKIYLFLITNTICKCFVVDTFRGANDEYSQYKTRQSERRKITETLWLRSNTFASPISLRRESEKQTIKFDTKAS